MIPAWTTGLPGFWVVLVVLGLCLGSFLNVVIHRLPRGLSLARSRSRCPHCERTLAPWDLIPVLSYLVLRGRCRFCRASISWRYPVVEILGALSLVVSALMSSGPIEAAVKAALLLALLAITWIDIDHQIIPDEISLPGIVIGIAAAPVLEVSRTESLVGLLAGAGSLLAVAGIYRLVRGIEGMGMGDVKLAGMLGAFLGWKGILMTIVLGSFLGSLIGISLMLAHRASGKTALPFGAFLAPAGVVVALAGPRIWETVFRFPI